MKLLLALLASARFVVTAKVRLFAVLLMVAITAGSVRDSLADEPNIVPDDPLITSFMQSDVWWALKSQRDLAIDERISNVMNIGTHNSFNASADGFERELTDVPMDHIGVQPNQLFTIKDQLRIGARLIELDVYDKDVDNDGSKEIVVLHGDKILGFGGSDWKYFSESLVEIRSWLLEADNLREIIFLDIEDGASGNPGLLGLICTAFAGGFDYDFVNGKGRCTDLSGNPSSGMIFTPTDREGDAFHGRWPTRNELLTLGKRVILFNHGDLSDGEANYRLFSAYSAEDEVEYIWVGSDYFFLTGNTDNTFRVFSDAKINDYWAGEDLPGNYQQNLSRFFAVRSDGLAAGPRAMVGSDVAYCTMNNVNFIKMDFLFGQEYDIEDIPGTSRNDFDTPGGWDNDVEGYSFLDNIRGNRLSRAVWSWQIDTYRHNPNIYFLSYQGLHSPSARVEYRTDGRHYAIQDGFLYSPSFSPFELNLSQDWLGAPTDSTNTYFRTTRGYWNTQQKENLYPFACAKTGSNGTEWQITQQEGAWNEGLQICAQEFNDYGQETWAFAGPVNGWQNFLLLLTRWNYAYFEGRTAVATAPVWINVSDEDNDADWSVRSSDQNFPPIADAGPDQTVSAGRNCTASLALNGLASFDPNGDSLTYLWSWDGNVATGASPTALLPLGTTTITLVVNDGTENSAADTVDISVIDNTEPEMNLAAAPQILWPPNHRMVSAIIEGSVSDNCDNASKCEITAVASNEPVDGFGDGNTTPDWKITGDLTVDLRAENARSRTGRVYTIDIACTDASDNSAAAALGVYVPHDQRDVVKSRTR